MDKNGAIGRGNELPWRLSTDLKRFRELTRGQTVLMGRKTYESILKVLKKPLPDRLNLVLSRTAISSAEQKSGVCFFTAKDTALKFLREQKIPQHTGTTFVIGGEQIYREFLPLVTKFYVTHVDTEVLDADAFFPVTDFSKMKCVHEERIPKDSVNEFSTRFCIYERELL